jgi:hypothetical protein
VRETGRISTASRTSSAFLWRNSSSSLGSAPIRARAAVAPAIQPTRDWGRSGGKVVVSSFTSDRAPAPRCRSAPRVPAGDEIAFALVACRCPERPRGASSSLAHGHGKRPEPMVRRRSGFILTTSTSDSVSPRRHSAQRRSRPSKLRCAVRRREPDPVPSSVARHREPRAGGEAHRGKSHGSTVKSNGCRLSGHYWTPRVQTSLLSALLCP